MAERRRKKRFRINKFRLILSAVIVIVIITFAVSVHTVLSLKKEQGQLRRENEALQQKKAQLEEELASINDSEYIEEQARRRLRLIKPGEILYITNDDKSSSDSDAADGE